MKINEILTEQDGRLDPAYDYSGYNAKDTGKGLWGAAKNLTRGAMGAIAGAKPGGAGVVSGFKGAVAAGQQNDKIAAVSNQAFSKWAQAKSAIQKSGATVTPQAFNNWMTQFIGTTPKEMAKGNAPPNDAEIKRLLTQNISAYMAQKLGATQSVAPGQPAAAGQQQGAAGAAQTPAQQAAAAKASTVQTGQITKTIPTLRMRDLQSVKNNVDKELARRQTQKAPATAAKAGAYGTPAAITPALGATVPGASTTPTASTPPTQYKESLDYATFKKLVAEARK